MKNLFRYIGIVALTTVIGFLMITCDGDGGGGDGGLPPAGDGSIDLSTGGQNWQVYDDDTGEPSSSTVTFSQIHGENISEYFEDPCEVKMTAGKLSLKLGTPKSEYLEDDDGYVMADGMSVSSGLKFFSISEFSSGNEEEIFWGSENAEVLFIYANKNGTVSGTASEGGYTVKINWDLKQGWNTVINKFDNNNFTSVTGKPGANFKWYL